jgi:hypothetical protein
MHKCKSNNPLAPGGCPCEKQGMRAFLSGPLIVATLAVIIQPGFCNEALPERSSTNFLLTVVADRENAIYKKVSR